METLRKLMELIRFSHTVFALPFALLSAATAWFQESVQFRPLDLLGIVLCMVFARSAAMAFNRLVDRDVDALNERTAGRHLPAGDLSPRTAWIFTILCGAGFILSTLLFLPRQLPVFLSIPVLAFLLSYSYAKRLTIWCHYWLSTALMLSPIATWIALTDQVSWIPVSLGGVIFFWVGGFDIIYACQDADFDRTSGLSSLPARFGIPRALRIALLSHLITIGCLFLFWWVAGFGYVFLAGIVAVSGLLIYEHTLVRPDDLSRVNIAFFQVNSVISIGLLGLGLIDLLL